MTRASYRARLAFCCLLSIVGAAFVAYGVNFQGVIWWLLLTIVIGTVLQGGSRFHTKSVVKGAILATSFFIVSSLAIYILLGAGMSGFRQDKATGVDIARVAARVESLGQSSILYLYAGVAIATAIVIVLASLAASYTIALLIRIWNIDESQAGAFQKRASVVTTIASLVIGLVAYFKAG